MLWTPTRLGDQYLSVVLTFFLDNYYFIRFVPIQEIATGHGTERTYTRDSDGEEVNLLGPRGSGGVFIEDRKPRKCITDLRPFGGHKQG